MHEKEKKNYSKKDLPLCIYASPMVGINLDFIIEENEKWENKYLEKENNVFQKEIYF